MASDRIWKTCRHIYAKLGLLPTLLLALVGFYAAYEVKVKLGINIFPHWGLHLPGPRALLGDILHGIRQL